MKINLITISLFLSTGIFAQDLTSKKGEPILPEKGDWSFSIDANPFLFYIGNIFNKGGIATTTAGNVVTNNNQPPSFAFLSNGQAFTGKYFVESNLAYRGTVRLGFGALSDREKVNNRMLTAPSASANGYPDQAKQVENKWTRSYTNFAASVGIEKRKGKTRIQGLYGVEAGIFLRSTRDRFKYGNALAVNIAPAGPGSQQNVTVNLDDEFVGAENVDIASALGINGANTAGIGGTAYARVTDRKNGTTFGFGARVFGGVEWFISPKVSLGGEFGWGLSLSRTSASTTVYQSTGNANTANPSANSDIVGPTTIKGAADGNWGFDVDNNNAFNGASGSIKLNFYF